MTRYFVWEQTLLGPVGRIWHGLQLDGAGRQQATLTQPVELDVDDERSIEELKKAYSYEQEQ